MPSPCAHAHVERSVLHEAEAARGIVELRRGHAEIEQDAVELEAGLDLVRALGQRGERREKDRNARHRRAKRALRFRRWRPNRDRDKASDRQR